MENKEYTELEQILQRTVEKQSQRISSLSLDLDLAHSQIEVIQEQEQTAKQEKESAEKEDKKNAKK